MKKGTLWGKGKLLKLFESYLSNRKPHVEIDIYRSQIIDSPNCSVVQGSKLSGLLYTLYSNEIPHLPNLMQTDMY